jgi:hypothetical protein
MRARHGGMIFDFGDIARFPTERAADGAAPGQHADFRMIETVELKIFYRFVKFMLMRKDAHDLVGLRTLTRHIHRCPRCDELPCDILSIGTKKQEV